jgi:hypothetical protein
MMFALVLAGALLDAGFDKDVQGWTAVPGGAQASHEPDDGDPRPGALRGVSDPGGSLTVLGPCLKVQPSTAYRFGAHLRRAKGNSYFCSLNVFQFSDAACSSGQEPLGSAGKPAEEKWTSASGAANTAAQAASVQPRAVCSGEPGFVVLWDTITFRR